MPPRRGLVIDVTPGLLERSPMLSKAVSDVLELTAERVERDGFGQYAMWDSVTGAYCTRGHYTQVVFEKFKGVKVEGFDVWKLVIDACEMVLTDHLGKGVAKWNDEPGRTKEEVVEALTKTAAEVRARFVG
jgi:hypothetical protein